MIRRYTLFFALLSFVFLSSCNDDNDTYLKRKETERNERRKYLEENGITDANLLEAGIYFQPLNKTENTGSNSEKVEIGDEVVIWYTGYFLDGRIFDSNVISGKFEPMTIRIFGTYSGSIINDGLVAGNVITGWPPALLQMKKGDKALIVVPSNLAYRTYGYGSVPSYTTLVFEIEVEDVRKANNS